MKLLYVWINRSRSGFIQKQGFNFSVEYKFSVDYSESDDCYVLSCEHDESSKDIWKTGNISGLTAVVGENGSGKTTLLNDLFSPEVFRKQKEDERPGYEEYYKKRNQLDEKIYAYELDGEVQIIHNLKEEKFQNKTTFDGYNVNMLEQDKLLEWMDKIERQTIVYLSNSISTSVWGGYSTRAQTLQSINLSPKSLRALSSAFLDKISLKSGKIGNFNTLHDTFRAYKRQYAEFDSQEIFQMILDIRYYLYLETKLENNPMMSNPIKQLRINVCKTADMFERNSDVKRTYLDTVQWATRGKTAGHLDAFSALIVFLIFEINCVFGKADFLTRDTEDKSGWNYLDYMKVAEKILEKCIGVHDENEEYLKYYERGLEEIRILYDRLKDAPHSASTLPPEDWAYHEDIVLSYVKDKEKYISFCKCIDAFAQYKHSFVLKYLQIESAGMSSGERALQNMFSWLLLPPSFDKYVDEKAVPIKDDVILLIDEIDLYMHPEWQRQCLKVLADNLKLQYPNKYIQIVVATHSPLVLSDVPKQNTIYLRGASARSSLDYLQLADYDEISETFGANVHQILSRSFFLNNTMGAYAYDIVHGMAENLAKLKNLTAGAADEEALKKTCESYLPTIKLIGEVMIRNKLLAMYYDCFPRDQKMDVQELEYSIAEVSNSAKHLERNQVQLLKEKLEKAAEELSEYL